MTLIVFLSVSIFAIDDSYEIMTANRKFNMGWVVDAIIGVYVLCVFVKFLIVSYSEWKKLVLHVRQMCC